MSIEKKFYKWDKNFCINDKILNYYNISIKHQKGIFSILPLGKKILNKIINLIKFEMYKLNIKEIIMPVIINKNFFLEKIKFNNEFLKIADKNNNNLILIPTAEEIAISIVKNLNKLEKIGFFQIQSKFRNEIRPRDGIIRTIEFIMKDCYIFDKNKYLIIYKFNLIIMSYIKIFKILNINVIPIITNNENIGGNFSYEFVTITDEVSNSEYYIYKTQTKKINKIIKNNIKLINTNFLSFSKEYVLNNKILLDNNYLIAYGMELAHSFYLGKIKTLNNIYMISSGIGITRLLGYIILNNFQKFNFKLNKFTIMYNIIIIPINKNSNVYCNYIYIILNTLKFEVLMINNKEHLNNILGYLNHFKFIYNIIINKKIYKFFMEINIKMINTKKILNLIQLLKFLNDR